MNLKSVIDLHNDLDSLGSGSYGGSTYGALLALIDGDWDNIYESDEADLSRFLTSAESVGVDDAAQLLSDLKGAMEYKREGSVSGRRSASRVVTAALSAADRQAITNESGSATNLHKLNLVGTHYVDGDEDVVNDDQSLFL